MEFVIIALSVINLCMTCYNHYLIKLFTDLKENCEDLLIDAEFELSRIKEKENKKNVN